MVFESFPQEPVPSFKKSLVRSPFPPPSFLFSPELTYFLLPPLAPLLSLLLPGSTHPSSLLLYAYTLFLAASPKSSSLLQSLRPDLSLAVLGCLEAASELWEPEQQRFLVRAAVYGRAWLEGEGDGGVVERGRGLKVVNCLRGWEVGMGISWEE